jgi:hypothetical protein
MDVGYDSGGDRVFIMWPIVVRHEINEHSPLYAISKADLATATIEIVAVLEGTQPATGSVIQVRVDRDHPISSIRIQARTSYTSDEIKWGHQFERLVTYQKLNGSYEIDFGKFHSTTAVPCPDMSAKQLHEMQVCCYTCIVFATRIGQ